MTRQTFDLLPGNVHTRTRTVLQLSRHWVYIKTLFAIDLMLYEAANKSTKFRFQDKCEMWA